MKEVIANLLNSQEGILLTIVTVMIGTNILMTCAKKFLGWVMVKTENKIDDKAYEVVAKVLSVLNKGLEFASANSDALPPKVKAELAKKEWQQERMAEVDAAIAKVEAPKAE